MKRLLLVLLLLMPSAAIAQCNGVFANGTVCGNFSGAPGVPGPSAAPLAGMVPNPTNLYVATTGADSGNCQSVGSPCATIAYAVGLARGFDLNGAAVVINLAAGTYTKGAIISGVFIRSTNAVGHNEMIEIVGAGAGSTIIDPSTNCGSGASAIYVSDGARVGLGSVTLQTSCTGGSDFSIQNYGLGFLADNDVNFGNANDALVRVGAHGKFDANYAGAKLLTISGSATYGFAGTTYAAIVTGIGVTNVISGTPAFSTTFVSLLDSFYNEGINSSWTNAGNATGTRYSIALNSHIDREQGPGSMPGSTPGLLEGLSGYYQNNAGTSDLPCVGGSGGCRAGTGPTGMGAGGTVTMFAGSGDHSGTATLSFGTTPGTTGLFYIAHLSILTGDWGGG
ncbi:MAG TPA: hypothetical protein VN203_28940, partial [Candidatus Acidoferrum sp.]|nr:hypothetical protein [Candidatus Acidoferrum sp.]